MDAGDDQPQRSGTGDRGATGGMTEMVGRKQGFQAHNRWRSFSEETEAQRIIRAGVKS
ncbi:MAG: hypothetical protein ABW192_00160 [Sphingobium sp.]